MDLQRVTGAGMICELTNRYVGHRHVLTGPWNPVKILNLLPAVCQIIFGPARCISVEGQAEAVRE